LIGSISLDSTFKHFLFFSGFASESDEDEGEGDEEELFEDDLEFLRSLDPKVR
jgi:hypothetical protein